MAVVDELVTLLGFEVDDADAKRFNATLDNVKHGALAVGAAITTAAGAIGIFTKKISAELDETGKFALSIGVDVEQLQGMEFAIQRAGGSISDLRGDLAGLTKELASPIPGEFNQALQFVFGINPFDEMTGGLKEADKVLLEVADKLEGLSPQKAQIMASQLGLSEGTIRLLVQGREEIERLGREAGSLGAIIPESATINAALLEDEITNLTAATGGLSKIIASSLFPGITKTIKKTNDWIKTNRGFIQQNVGGVIRGITVGFDNFINIIQTGIQYVSQFIPVMDSLTGSFDVFESVSAAVTGALIVAAIAISPLIIKIGLIASAVTAVILVLEDLIKWFKGSDSVIGSFAQKFLTKFPGIARVLDKIKESIMRVFDSFKNLLSVIIPQLQTASKAIKEFFSTEAGQEFIDFILFMPKTIGNTLAEVLNIFSTYVDLIAALFSGDGGAILKAFNDLGSQIIDSFINVFKSIAENAKKFLPDFLVNMMTSEPDDVVNSDTREKKSLSDKIKGIVPDVMVRMVGGDVDKSGKVDENRSVIPSIINRVQTSGPSNTSSTVNNNDNRNESANSTINITVNGSDSPRKTAAVIQRTIQNPMARTLQTGSAGTLR